MICWSDIYRKKDEQEAYDNYRTIINNTAMLCRELKLQDMKSIFVVFEYLLWNGYFSEDKKYAFSINDRYRVWLCNGMSIMTGYGVCMNDADMFRALLRKMKFETNIINGFMPDYLKRSYDPCIKRRVKTDGSEKDTPNRDLINAYINYIVNTSTNHTVTLGMNDNEAYLFDPTNLCIYNLEKMRMAKIISGKGYFKPYIKDDTCEYVIEDLTNALKKSSNPNLDVQTLFSKNVEHCESNISLIEDYYAENRDSIAKVAKEVRILGKRP